MQEIDRIVKERQEIFSSLSNEHAYLQLGEKLSIKFNNVGRARSMTDTNEIKKLMNDPLLTHENKALTFYSRQHFYNILQCYHGVSGDMKKVYLFAKKKVDLYLSYPEKTKRTPVSYLIAMNNLISVCNELKKHDEEKYYLTLLSKHSALLTAKHEKSLAFFIFHHSNMHYYITTGQFEAAMPLAEKLQRELQDEEDKQNQS